MVYFCLMTKVKGGVYIGKALLRIGQVAKLSGLSTRTIDYYTQCNLLPVERSASNYRLYPEDVLQTLERIKLLKHQRMSISEIKSVILSQEDSEVVELLHEVQDEIECLQKKIVTLEEKLKDLPEEEKKQIYHKIEPKLLDVMTLMALM